MNEIFKRIGFFFGMLMLIVFVEALVIGLPALIISHFFMADLLNSDVFESAAKFWEQVFTIATMLFIPPFVMFSFRAFPTDFQDDIRIVGLSLLDMMIWAGYGFFFAMGAGLYWYLLI